MWFKRMKNLVAVKTATLLVGDKFKVRPFEESTTYTISDINEKGEIYCTSESWGIQRLLNEEVYKQ